MKPLILVTNDDGPDCAGLMAAAQVARRLGDVLIVVPATRQTGMSRSFPRFEKQGIIERMTECQGKESGSCFAVLGSPAQAVAHGVLEIADRHPSLCISGINIGENLGATNQISGTVGAAYEAAGMKIPALAVSTGPEEEVVSRNTYEQDDWAVAQSVVLSLASEILQSGLHPDVAVLNVNIPMAATTETEVRITAQSHQNHYVCQRPEPRDFSSPCRLPVSEGLDFETLERDSDAWAFLIDGVISVTPMGYDATVRGKSGAPLDFRRR